MLNDQKLIKENQTNLINLPKSGGNRQAGKSILQV